MAAGILVGFKNNLFEPRQYSLAQGGIFIQAAMTVFLVRHFLHRE